MLYDIETTPEQIKALAAWVEPGDVMGPVPERDRGGRST